MIPGQSQQFFEAAAAQSGAAAYEIERSLRFNDDDTAYLSRYFTSVGNRQTWTWSGWLKQSGTTTSWIPLFQAYDGSSTSESNFLQIAFYGNQIGVATNTVWFRLSDAVYRDYSAWMHIVVAFDTTQSVADDRVKIYVNGDQLENFTTFNNPSLNTSYGANRAIQHQIAQRYQNNYLDGYLADVHFIDGQALAPTYFGGFDADTGVWNPKEFSGTYVLPAATVQVGTPSYPSDFTSTGDKTSDQTGLSFSSWSGSYTGAQTKIFKASDDTRFDLEISLLGGTNDRYLWYSNNLVDWVYIGNIASLGNPYKVVGFKYYATSEGSGSTTLSAESVAPGANSFHLNFSDNSSDQALGYDATTTTPTLNPRGGMDVVTYTGNGSTKTIGGLGFAPDLVWIKRRNAAVSNFLHDTVRGFSNGNAYELRSDSTNAESVPGTASTGLTSFNSDGFSIGSDGGINTNGGSYVAWTWKAGGPAVLNEDGSIDSQVSVSTDYGFSIVTWSGSSANATIGHGLSSAPKMIFMKRRDGTTGFYAYNSEIGATKTLYLYGTTAAETFAAAYNNTDPTSSVFSVGTSSATNSGNMLAYCWSEISGFSKFGSYTGNGSTNGPTITTGFQPRLVVVKRTDSVGNWTVFDSARNLDNDLKWNTNEAEGTLPFTFLSDGFQPNSSTGSVNASGGSYIYMAFADRPGNNWTTNNLIAEAGFETASQGMDVVTYSGNSSTQDITGLDFQPDLVWIKARNDTSYHFLTDSVRGVNKHLASNATDAEGNVTAVTAFNSDGFSLANQANVNDSAYNYVAWCWKAGGTAESNTDGSITSSVSANTTYGFSIVTYTGNGTDGATVGHGLNATPEMVIVKRRDVAQNWPVAHSGITISTQSLGLNLTNNAVAYGDGWINAWSSTTFTTNQGAASIVNVNANTGTYVAYCWSEVPGFSRFGSFTHSATTSLEFGFKPKYWLVKQTDGTGPWYIFDAERDNFDDPLFANTTGTEGSGFGITVTDTGISWVSGSFSAGTYIYAAFAGKPPGDIVDSLIDTPTNYEADSGNNGGNYCTLNPLAASSNIVLSNGNLEASSSVSNFTGVLGTFVLNSGKWYFEMKIAQQPAAPDIGWHEADYTQAQLENFNGGVRPGAYVVATDGNNTAIRSFNDSTVTTISSTSWATGDVIGCAIDMDAKKIWFRKNNDSWYPATSGGSTGDPATGTNPTITYTYDGFLTPRTCAYGTTYRPIINFGAYNFSYSPPTGYKSLCTQNLTDPTIAAGSTAMDAVTYDGNGSTQTISGLGLSPDLVWIKQRNAASDHNLFDIVRGVQKRLFSNSTAAEGTISTGLTAFNSDGWTMGSSGNINGSGNTYVGWAWDAGTTTETNDTGSITASVRANPSVGFSIVSYTGNGINGASVGHGLNAALDFLIVKRTSSSNNWWVFHSELGGTQYLVLDNGNAAGTSSLLWSNTAPTSSIIYLGSGESNTNSEDYIAYCFASVEGYSAFGSYIGTGTSNGQFNYTGFRPKFIMYKESSNTGNWNILDTSRNTYNSLVDVLFPNISNAETDSPAGSRAIDALANGFKIRGTDSDINTTNETYVWAAFAENPFKIARAR